MWNVSSTAIGGGVAEMLQVLVGYSRDVGIDARWTVLHGDPEFFAVTNASTTASTVSPATAAGWVRPSRPSTPESPERRPRPWHRGLRPGDVVRPARPPDRRDGRQAGRRGGPGGLAVPRGEDADGWTGGAWAFLRPHLAACERFVFTLRSYAPAWLDPSTVDVVLPSIDPFSPKNRDLAPGDDARVLRHVGLLDGGGSEGPVAFVRRDGSPGRVAGRATVLGEGPPPDAGDRLVVQVSRWDRLKDMAGVLEGFASAVAGRADARLLLAGPSVAGVTDDPEGADVYAACATAWERLPVAVRRRVTLATLPEDDVDENATVVNALQRHATVVVQKSLVEGFGLTVTEAMWKERAVVASRVGGIAGQLVPGTGVLLDDPTDLGAFGDAVVGLLGDPAAASRLGARARRSVLERFMVDNHLEALAEVLGRLSE